MTSSFGTFGNYNSETPIRTIYSNNIIAPVSGVNPVDLGYVKLPNIRGYLTITIISTDNSYKSIFEITGGWGEYATDYTQNWYPQTFSFVGCVVTVLFQNTIQIQTPVADAGGRTYIMQFFPVQSVGPQIKQSSINIIGNNNLIVKITKNVVSSF